MAEKRILVVDDSVVVRRILGDAIGADPDLVVVGSAQNGRVALEKIEALRPDLVVLDVEMPEMDGLETLSVIRARWLRLPVVMFSTLTERGAQTTIEALCRGASDYAAKPSQMGSPDAARKHLAETLIPKLRALVGLAGSRDAAVLPVPAPASVAPSATLSTPRAASAAARVAAPTRSGPPEVVAIGVSTGGPNALADVLPRIPKGFALPVVLVQHMPPSFTRLLAERLDEKCAVRVLEATHGLTLQPGHVYVAPGNHHMRVERRGASVALVLDQDPPENSCRPAVDPLFRSVAQVYGGRALAVVLTGMGHDGQRGCVDLRAAGAQIVAQDQATSVVWGMPGAVVAAGLADAVVPLAAVADEIVRRCGTPRAPRPAR